MKQIFTEHPQSVGETYAEHMYTALSFSRELLIGALACGVHAFLPFLFKTTASKRIVILHDRMVTHRKKCSRTPTIVEATANP